MPARRTSKTSNRKRGLFITFEGGEGAGKSTQTDLLLKKLVAVGEPVILVKEPGSSPLGTRLRPLLKGEVSMTDKAELLLFLAARAELVTTVIAPALDKGINIIADRFSDSTFAYQGLNSGFSYGFLSGLNRIATDGLTPDVTFLLKLPPEESLRRSRGEATLTGTLDGMRQAEASQQKFESKPLAFHRKLAEKYRWLAAQEPSRWAVIDGTQSVEDIADQVWDRVEESLKKAKRSVRRRSGVGVSDGKTRLI